MWSARASRHGWRAIDLCALIQCRFICVCVECQLAGEARSSLSAQLRSGQQDEEAHVDVGAAASINLSVRYVVLCLSALSVAENFLLTSAVYLVRPPLAWSIFVLNASHLCCESNCARMTSGGA